MNRVVANRRIISCAERFWSLVAKPEPFPRSLESSVSWSLPLALVKMPHLGIGIVKQWLRKNNIPSYITSRNRPLRAYLVARAGKGIVFIDGTDPDDERRFSLAHEVAHFLLDYLLPREAALKSFGEEIRDILDGYRLPTPDERLKGILRGIKLGAYSHLIDRSADGEIDRIYILRAEDDADLLALELLAPISVVVSRLNAHGISWTDTTVYIIMQELLTKEFGLPAKVAENYGRYIVSRHRPFQSFIKRLGM